jgi:hypothetical protein
MKGLPARNNGHAERPEPTKPTDRPTRLAAEGGRCDDEPLRLKPDVGLPDELEEHPAKASWSPALFMPRADLISGAPQVPGHNGLARAPR